MSKSNGGPARLVESTTQAKLRVTRPPFDAVKTTHLQRGSHRAIGGRGTLPSVPLACKFTGRVYLPREETYVASPKITALPSTEPTLIEPSDLLSLNEVAERLRATEQWVREKCRRRCQNPIPVHNVGRHLLFCWSEVSAWIRNSPRPIHTKHHRRQHSATEKKAA